MIQIEPITGPSHRTDFDAHAADNGLQARLISHGPPGPWNRWSYLPQAPRLLLRCDALTGIARLSDYTGIVHTWPDPLSALTWLAGTLRETPTDGPPFKGGWIGWLSYDLGRWFERLPTRAMDDFGLPLFEFTFHAQTDAIDEHAGSVWRIRCGNIFGDHPLIVPCNFGAQQVNGSVPPMRSNMSRSGFESAVARAIDYISAGDVFQVNLSHRFTAPLREHPVALFDRSRQIASAWFGAYLSYGDHALISTSPELFLQVTPDPATGRRRIVTRPIKGTRLRGPGMRDQLQRSPKDQAELNMIVDLERNDLGRVCRIGSIAVTEPRSIESHETVYHGVATVEGTLRDDVTLVDLLAATFPGGSVTAAPKIRAMQIIEELEPTRRGPYCGAIGYLSCDGNIGLNIAIRTMIVENGQIHLPVGGGIVADSNPAAEYEETLVKAQAMLATIEASEEKPEPQLGIK